jgi:Kef-type K+ transport system membrane component KefB
MYLFFILAFIFVVVLSTSIIHAILSYFNADVPQDGLTFFGGKYIIKNLGLVLAILVTLSQADSEYHYIIIVFPMLNDLLVNVPLLIAKIIKRNRQLERNKELTIKYG